MTSTGSRHCDLAGGARAPWRRVAWRAPNDYCRAMRQISFTKMHGLGNDFVVVDARREPIELTAAQLRRIADRHRGVGFDQLVRLEPSPAAHARLAFFNSDGSEAEACGNGARCAARLLLEEAAADEVTLDTRAGVLSAHGTRDGRFTVALPPPRFAWHEIPLAQACDTLAVPIELEGLPQPVAINLGNPHAVFFVADLETLEVERLGAILERHPIFPERANIGFASVDRAASRVRLRVFERGAGLTQACGSGACAALVAAVRRGLLGGSATLQLDGGELEVAWDGTGPVLLTGPASRSFTGTLTRELLDA